MTKERIYIKTSIGELTLRQISEYNGVRLEIIKSRYARGWRGDDLLKPLSTKGKKVMIEFRGELVSIYEIAERTGIPFYVIYSRHRNGLTGDDLIKPIKKTHSHIGERYGSLTVIGESRKNGQIFVTCKCDCGNTCYRFLSALRNEAYSHNCGCKRNWRSTHNMSKTKEHKAWRHIKERCLNPNSKNYKNYGGRGIKICEEWASSFEKFYKDMGPAPSREYSIDRIDVNGDYCPENCRWATKITQMRNKRNTVYVEYQEETMPLRELAERVNVPAHNIYEILRRGGSAQIYLDRLLKKR